MKIETIFVDDVVVLDRHRPVDEAKVASLAQSMAEIGLLHPISVWADSDSMELVAKIILIAGRHRLMAAMRLGWKQIDCSFLNGWSDVDRQICEIDENLARAGLTPAQEADHLRRRKELFELKAAGANCATSLRDGRPAGPQHQKGFAAGTAALTGKDKATINRAVARAQAIPDITNVVGTCLDKGIELDALAKKSVPEQAALIRQAKAGVKISARDHPSEKSEASTSSSAEQVSNLRQAWNQAGTKAPKLFLDSIGARRGS